MSELSDLMLLINTYIKFDFSCINVGASIADRIEIDGISCFVLSREPFPALQSAMRRHKRQQQREDIRLGTICEQLSFGHASVNVSGFVQRNVILHLTGGGFFAHT